MKNNMSKSYFFLFVFVLFLYSCDKTPSGQPPVLTISNISNIAYNTANCNGTFPSNGGSEIVVWGVCWSTSQNPTIKDSKIEYPNTTGGNIFITTLTGLVQSTAYNVRAYATNSNGTTYGNQISFTTQTGDQQTRPIDVDGNVYHSVTIGSQTWMVENLRTTHYRNGNTITNVTDNSAWTLNGSSYCNYNNDLANSTIYGNLYNRYVATNPNNIAPLGWHVPSDVDWFILQQYVSGGGLKDRGTLYWKNPNTSATNISGFTALPSGERSSNGIFSGIGSYCYWWSTGGWSGVNIWGLSYSNNSFQISGGTGKEGMSIRCIRD